MNPVVPGSVCVPAPPPECPPTAPDYNLTSGKEYQNNDLPFTVQCPGKQDVEVLVEAGTIKFTLPFGPGFTGTYPDLVLNCQAGGSITRTIPSGSTQAQIDAIVNGMIFQCASAIAQSRVRCCPVFANEQVVFTHLCPIGTTLTFTGTLPTWITLDAANGQLIGAAGMFTGETQVLANAAAQDALNEFGNAALADGTLSCPTCAPLPFEAQTINGNIDGSVPAPDRPGSFAQLVPFNGVAGQNLNLWMWSNAFDEYLILVDPDGIIVLQENSNAWYPGGGGFFSAGLHTVLAKTGTYTIECTTTNPGDTGLFTLEIAPHYVTTSTFNGIYTSQLILVESTQDLATSKDESGVTTSVLLNPVTGATVNSIGLPLTEIFGGGYSPTLGHYYIGGLFGFGNDKVMKVDALGNEISTVPITLTSSSGRFAVFNPDKNQIIVVGSIKGGDPGATYALVDCATMTVIKSGMLARYYRNGFYRPTNKKFYFWQEPFGLPLKGNVFAIDDAITSETDTLITLEDPAANPLGVPTGIYYLPTEDRLVGITTGTTFAIINLDTTATDISYDPGVVFSGASDNDCRGQIRITFAGIGMIALKQSDLSPANNWLMALNTSTDWAIAPTYVTSMAATALVRSTPAFGHVQTLYVIP